VIPTGIHRPLELGMYLAHGSLGCDHQFAYDVEAVVTLHTLADDGHAAVLLQPHEARVIEAKEDDRCVRRYSAERVLQVWDEFVNIVLGDIFCVLLLGLPMCQTQTTEIQILFCK
jgi:hypothetical protein